MKSLVTIICLIILTNNFCTNKKSSRKSIFYKGLKKEAKHSSTTINSFKTNVQFKNTIQGDIVKHDFFIKNNSQKKVKITNIWVKCCIHITYYSKEIMPGGYGIISTSIYTDIYGGKKINDQISIETNSGKKYYIYIQAPVTKFADIKPFKIRLSGSVKNSISGSSIIIPEKKFPFNIKKIQSKKGNNIKITYSEIDINGKNAYKITVFNTKKTKGQYRDKLFIETDNPAQQELRIRVNGNIH